MRQEGWFNPRGANVSFFMSLSHRFCLDIKDIYGCQSQTIVFIFSYFSVLKTMNILFFLIENQFKFPMWTFANKFLFQILMFILNCGHLNLDETHNITQLSTFF